MDNLSDILAKKDLSEPPEYKIIKEFVLNKYEETVNIKIDISKITILVSNSALANSLRMNIPELQELCNTTKRIVIYLNN